MTKLFGSGRGKAPRCVPTTSILEAKCRNIELDYRNSPRRPFHLGTHRQQGIHQPDAQPRHPISHLRTPAHSPDRFRPHCILAACLTRPKPQLRPIAIASLMPHNYTVPRGDNKVHRKLHPAVQGTATIPIAHPMERKMPYMPHVRRADDGRQPHSGVRALRTASGTGPHLTHHVRCPPRTWWTA